MFYDNFINICEDRGVSPTRVLNELKISKGSLSRWKENGEPLNETKKKIADYFGITVKQLMAGEIEKPATVSNGGLSEKKRELYDVMADLSEENQDKILELARLYVEAQRQSKDKK